MIFSWLWIFGMALMAAGQQVTDVCVLGAGASGLRAAVAAKDHGLSTMVFERQEMVGGNCRTYFDPRGPIVQLGVVVWPNVTSVTNLLDRFHQPYEAYPLEDPRDLLYYNFATGHHLSMDEIYIPSLREHRLGVEGVKEIQRKYSHFMQAGKGYPHDIPEELLLPYGDFMDLYNLKGVWIAFRALSTGSPSLEMPAYEALALLRPEVFNIVTPAEGITGSTGLWLPDYCDTLYQSMADYVGWENVVLSSNIDMISRPSDGFGSISYTVGQTSEHRVQLCKQIVVSFDQSNSTMSIFDLDEREIDIWSQVIEGNYATFALRFPNQQEKWMPLNWNYDEQAFLQYPSLPTSLMFRTDAIQLDADTGMEMRYGNVHFTQPPGYKQFSIPEMEQLVAADLARIGFAPSAESVEFLEMALHQFNYLPNAQAQKDGWYGAVDAMQGYRNTWYTGSMLSYESQYDCWIHGEDLVNRVVLEVF